MQRLHRPGTPAIVGAVLLVALLVGMALNTKFVTAKELDSIGPQSFSPEKTAATLFKKANSDFGSKAAPVSEVVPAIQEDSAAAAKKYESVNPNAGVVVFPVTATGTVTKVSSTALQLKVDGIPNQTLVLVSLRTAINGTVLRDALGFKFADAPGQSDFQYVGDELKKLMQGAVQEGIGDPSSVKGKKITVLGVISAVEDAPQPKAKPVNIQPVSVEAAS